MEALGEEIGAEGKDGGQGRLDQIVVDPGDRPRDQPAESRPQTQPPDGHAGEIEHGEERTVCGVRLTRHSGEGGGEN